jgi:hypothetical protein
LIRASQILEQISCLYEAITSEIIDKWEREYFNFALMAPRVRDGKELREVAESFGEWIDSFTNFLDKNVLGLKTRLSNYLRHESYIQDWSHQLKDEFRASLFPVRVADFLIAHKKDGEFSSFIDEFLQDFGGGTHQVFGTNDTLDWESFFQAWEEAFDRDHLPFIEYQEIGKQMFKTLRHDIEKDGTVYDAYKEEVITIGSVKVFTYRAENQDFQTEELRDIISGLKIAMKKMQDRGLSKAFVGGKVLLDRQSDEYTREEEFRNTRALYTDSTDTVEVWYVSPNLVGDFIHEFAHRFHRKIMSERQRKAWQEFCINNIVEIRTSDIDKILKGLDGFSKKFDTLSLEDFLDGWRDYLDRSGAGEDIVEKFVALGTFLDGVIKFAYPTPNAIKSDIVFGIKKTLIYKYPSGVRLFKHPISHYGASKSDPETYAEVFRLYCENKPISEIVRVEFERTSGLQ